MFIDPQNTPGFKRSIFNAIVAPRPIGWISSMGEDGSVNLAPFSQFNLVSTAPPVVMFSCNTPQSGDEKDTVANVRATGEFVVNLVSWNLREAMNITSTPLPRGTDEFELAGLRKAACVKVRVPRVEASPANLGEGQHFLVDLFSPPRADFIGKGWVAHSDDDESAGAAR